MDEEVLPRMIPFQYEFFPVGQGLFSYGVLNWLGSDQKLFSWVYDCGSATSVVRTHITNGINRIKRMQEPISTAERVRSTIDLVFLSHFDDDHISGIKQLLGEFKVDTLVLPYMSFEQLILIAIEEGIDANNPLFPFFADPVSFLTTPEEASIARILFVPPSGTEGPRVYEEPVTPPDKPNNSDDEERTIKEQTESSSSVDYEKNSDHHPDHKPSETGGELSPQVRILRPGAAILVDDYWEFVPYNDDPEREIDEAFKSAVREKRNALLAAGTGSEQTREDALKELKKVYDKHFGKDGEARNIISLFLYTGPKGPLNLRHQSWPVEATAKTIAEAESGSCYSWMNWDSSVQANKVSILYSGDGYLDSSKRLDRMMNYLRKERIDRCAVFQVMHHGAEGNWHKGVAEAIKPSFSVFSSHPFRGKWQHPHAPVLRDFWTYGPVQVDHRKGFSFGVRSWI